MELRTDFDRTAPSDDEEEPAAAAAASGRALEVRRTARESIMAHGDRGSVEGAEGRLREESCTLQGEIAGAKVRRGTVQPP